MVHPVTIKVFSKNDYLVSLVRKKNLQSWFGLVGFNCIIAIVGYLIPNPLYKYILNIRGLAWLGLMAYQPL